MKRSLKYALAAAVPLLLLLAITSCSPPAAETVTLGENRLATPEADATRIPRAVVTVAPPGSPAPLGSPRAPLTATVPVTLTPGGTISPTIAGTVTLTPTPLTTATGTTTPMSTTTPTPTGSPTPTGTLTPTPSPATTGTPTPTPSPATTGTPTPSREVLSFAGSLAQKIESFREAVRTRDTSAMLRQQRELLAEAEKAEAGIKEDRSQSAEHLRSAIRDIRDGASGDTAKLDGALRELREAVGKQDGEDGVRDRGTRTPTPTATELRSMAESLSRRVESFDGALQSRNSESILRQQKELLEEMDRVERSLSNDRTKQGEQVRSALEAIRNALAGDQSKLDEAKRALRRALEE